LISSGLLEFFTVNDKLISTWLYRTRSLLGPT